MNRYLKIGYNLGLGAGLVLVVFLGLVLLDVPGLDLDLLVVKSGSMEPAIRTGSLVLIDQTGSYEVGDIVTYQRNNYTTPVTHRIIEKSDDDQEGSIYITKGDANETRDIEPVSKSMILGQVRFSVPFLGYVVGFARTWYGFVLLIIIPALVIGFDEIRKLRKEVKNFRSTA